MTINYVVAAYAGPRGFIDPDCAKDPWHYLHVHLESLQRLAHHLSHVTVVINNYPVPLPPPIIPPKLRDAVVSVLFRPNIGFSYGGFADAFAAYGTGPSHYILNEDDYLFTHDDFDQMLLDELATRHSCGLLCGAAWRFIRSVPHNVAAVSTGIATSRALASACETRGGRLSKINAHDYPNAYRAQIDFGYAIQDGGGSVEDWLSKWATAYRHGHGTDLLIRWFTRPSPVHTDPYAIPGDTHRRAFLIPVQAIGREVMVDAGVHKLVGRISLDGSFHPSEGS